MKKKAVILLDKYAPVIMLLPAILALLVIEVYPSLSAIRMSFFNIILTNPARPFIGLGNYIEMFKDPTVIRVLINTFFWAVMSLVIGSIFALFVAVQLNKPFRGRGFFRALFLAPWVTPPLVIAMVWQQIFNPDFSPINGLLLNLGWISHPIDFLGNATTYLGFISIPMLCLIIINIWAMLPFSMVMFLTSLQTIPNELYEAATVDGASKGQKFRSITLPLMLPAAEISILLQGIWQFNSFNLSYLVTHGGPLNTTELLSVRIYNEAFISYNYGFASAISVVMLLVVLIPAIMYIRRTLKADNLSAM